MLHHTTFQKEENSEWVTFIHGAGGSSSIWFKQLREFRKHFNVLLIDLRGHGKSKSPIHKKLQRYTFEVISDEVIEVMDHLNIKKTHFIGISLGTVIIRDITERHPDRTRSLVLGGAVMKLNFRGQILMRMGFLLKSVLPYIFIYKLFAFIIMPRKNHRESRVLFIREARKLAQKEFIRWFSLTADVNPLLSLFRIKNIGVPTLYIMGAQDHMFLPSISKIVRDHHSSILFVVPNCGHVVNIEQPGIFNKEAINFLTQKQINL